MAALRNLSRLRESCERMATADPDTAEEPLISMEDCYTIDGRRYEKTDKLEKEKFGETRLEKINKYTLEYRERQKNLLIRRDLINSKFNEVIFDIIESANPSNTRESGSELPITTMANETVIRATPPKAIPESLGRKVDVKNARIIRELQREINILKDKIDKNTDDFQTELSKFKNLGKNEEMIRKKLGIDNWDDFIKHVNNNTFEYKLGELLNLINENNVENIVDDNVSESLVEAAAKAEQAADEAIKNAQQAKDALEAASLAASITTSSNAEGTEGTEGNVETFQGSRNDLAQKLSVYENIGKISIERSPTLAARANNIIDNSISLVGDFETLATDIIKNIRDRYYNSENGDYKELVEKTGVINDNHIKNNLLNDANKFSDKNLLIHTDKYNKLKGTTKMLGIILFVILVVSLVLVGQLI